MKAFYRQTGLLSVSLLAFVLFSGIAGANTDSINISDINISVGQIIQVNLTDISGSTGYVWVIGEKPDGLWLIGSHYVSSGMNIPGAPCTKVFTFYGAKKCQGSIEFIQARLWEPVNSMTTKCRVKIN